MTSSVAGWRRSSKALLKAKPVPKKVMVTVWLSAAHLIHYCFLNPSETIIADKYVQQIDEMHRKLQCMQPAGQHKGPNSSPWQHLTTCGTTKASKGEWIRLQQVLPQLPYSPKLLPTDYHFFKKSPQLSAGKNLPQWAGDQKCFPRVCQVLKHRFLYYRNKLISYWKKCWL